jgi:hypothetical protein
MLVITACTTFMTEAIILVVNHAGNGISKEKQQLLYYQQDIL